MADQRQRIVVIESSLAAQKLPLHVLTGPFNVRFAIGALDALTLVAEHLPDLILLNLTSPGLDGAEICGRIREYYTTPILLMGPDQAADALSLLALGADDCLTTPFAADELQLRIHTLLRHPYWRERPNLAGPVQLGYLQIDFQRELLLRDGRWVYLSQIEWGLLELLVRHAGKVVRHEILQRSTWGDTSYRESSNLHRYINRLRHKLELDPENPRYLVSEWGVGYRFRGQFDLVNEPVENTQSASTLAKLSMPSTSFVGWAAEVEHLKLLLQTPGVRLVSLTGFGGVGKTRLGLQVALQLAETFEHGVRLVSLAAIQNASLVGAAIAQALGIKEEKGLSIEKTLQAHLADRQMLLLLDNFEQVMGATNLVADLLAMGSGLKILVTSRSLLHLEGEHAFEVPPLALPDLRWESVVEAAQSPAVTLFVQRAQAVQPAFMLTLENVATVVELCIQLDGMPLAIELAAAQSESLTPQAIAACLLPPYAVYDLPRRQQAMRHVLNWSYNLLPLEEKILFARLAVFNGGCTMDAVESIAGVSFESTETGRVSIDPLEQLPALLNKGMLQHKMIGNEMRFEMIETIREYACERLECSGEAELLRERHIAYYLRLAEAAQPRLESAESQLWVDRLEQEHDNLRAALQWALDRESKGDTALQFATTLGLFWKSCGYWSEGRRWLEALLFSDSGTRPMARAQAFREAAWLALMQGDCTQAEKFLEMGQALWPALKDDPDATCIMALILDGQAKYDQARTLLQTVLESYRQLNDKKNIDFALHLLGQIAMKQADYNLAEIYMKEACAIQRASTKADIARSILTLAHISRLKGDLTQAGEQYRKSLIMFEEVGLAWGVGHCMLNLGKIACERREFTKAGYLYLNALNIFDALGDRAGLTYCLEAQASLAGLQLRTARAARLWGAAQTLRKILSTPLPPADLIEFEAEVKKVYDFLRAAQQSDVEFLAAWHEGVAMSLKDALTFAKQPLFLS